MVPLEDGMGIVFEYKGVRYTESEEVYPVREDTLFLVGLVEDRLRGANGWMLEMGAGTGLASLVAASMGWNVSSVDREPSSLSLLRYNLSLNDLSSELYLSDLFEGLPGRFLSTFDLIIFNPPYLRANGEEVDRRADLALVGGKDGTFVAERFLRKCRPFLADEGRIIILGYSGWEIEGLIESCALAIVDGPPVEKDIDGEILRAYILEGRS
ncbi:MAG: methyltransferase [Thermoplasmatota archaeon]